MSLLNTYRVLSYVTGVLLVALTFATISKYAFDNEWPVHTLLSIGHGWLYMAYVLVTLVLSRRMQWSLGMTLLVAVAGTVPFAVFFAEHKVMRLANEKAAARERATA